MLIFCEIWQAEVINHIPRPHQHTQPILLQQLEKVTMGSIPHELGQLVVHVVRLSKVPVPAEEVQAEHGGEEEAEPRTITVLPTTTILRGIHSGQPNLEIPLANFSKRKKSTIFFGKKFKIRFFVVIMKCSSLMCKQPGQHWHMCIYKIKHLHMYAFIYII